MQEKRYSTEICWQILTDQGIEFTYTVMMCKKTILFREDNSKKRKLVIFFSKKLEIIYGF